MTERMENRLAAFSDNKLIEALHAVSGPLVRELAKRGYDVRINAPAVQARDGHHISEFCLIQRTP